MPELLSDPTETRRDALLQASIGVFMRYGYRKTSMDDLARAAGLSRQGLYLHFANKEALFKAAIEQLAQTSVATVKEVLAQSERPLEDRLLDAFVALRSHGDSGEIPADHMSELLATAMQLAGPVIEELDRSMFDELTRALQAGGMAPRWKAAGLNTKDLARHLQATSMGVKQQAKTVAEYRERMAVAVRLVCRGGRDT